MAFPKVSDWSEKTYNAGALGFNLLRDFEKEMHKAYPDTQPYNFGYFADFDINNTTVMGWRPLLGSMFDVEDFNATVGLRFGLTVDASDKVKYGENYIMLMPREHRETVILPARREAIKKVEAAADEDAVIVHPEDPEYNKMKDRGRELAKTERVRHVAKGEPDRGETEKKSDAW